MVRRFAAKLVFSPMTTSIATTDLLALLGAIPVAALGGEAFLKGVLGLAAWARLPKMLVATTLAAFATSSPELTVSTMAALAGRPAIGLGDALGSNVVNVALILGLALLFGPLSARFSDVRRDFLLALAVPILTLVMTSDGIVTRAEGALLLTVFAAWLTLTARQALHHRRNNSIGEVPIASPIKSILFAIVGLTCMIVAGKLFVSGAGGIATALGIHPYIIGATVVAMGTSLPELVTTLLSRIRGHDDVGLGTLLGSNLFNGLGIVGVAASIHPISVPFTEVAVALGFGILSMILMVPVRGEVSRMRGPMLLAAYASFVLATLRTGAH
jgi:cation:H+ antiporter